MQRSGYWTAMVLAAFGLAAMFFNPLVGAFHAALFFAIAHGIRTGRPAAAVAGAVVVAAPMIFAWRHATGAALIVPAVFSLTCAALFAAAAFRLRAAGGRPSAAWPVLTVLLLAASAFLRPFMMPTGSMEDTLLSGDYLLVDTGVSRFAGPHRGELVAFHPPQDPRQSFIKRVIGVPGDRIRIQNKQVYLNGAPLAEPYARHKTGYTDDYRDNFPGGTPPHHFERQSEAMLRSVRGGEVIVPPGMYFVLGDNRDSSLDSRYFGFIERRDVMGRPLIIYGSYQQDRGMESVLNMRWGRLLKTL